MAALGRRVLLQSFVILLIHATTASDNLNNEKIELSRLKRAVVPQQDVNQQQKINVNLPGNLPKIQPPVLDQQNRPVNNFQQNQFPSNDGKLRERIGGANPPFKPVRITNQIQDSVIRQNQGLGVQPKRSGKKHAFKLADLKECRDDVQRLCSSTSQKNNFAILDCLQKDVKVAEDVSRDCQHVLWSYKRNLTKDDRFEYAAAEVCKEELQNIPECSGLQKGNGLVIPCLVDAFNNISNINCRAYIKKMKKIIFSDYRLVYKFVDACNTDIEMLKCGRTTLNDDEVHSQGKVLACLSEKLGRVSDNCKHQVLRVAELQADDYHLDRQLYYACQNDREHLCPNTPAGQGKIYKCLVKHKFDREMSQECRDKLTVRQNIVAQDVKAENTFYRACRGDIKKTGCFGKNQHGEDARRASVLLCLENSLRKGEVIESECVAEMSDLRQSLMDDYQINPEIVANCDKEIKKHCNGGLERGGKTIHCLMDVARLKTPPKRSGGIVEMAVKNEEKLEEKCMRALEDLVQEADVGSDYRMDRALQLACQPVVDTACRGIKPGDARILNCLMEHLDSSKMTDECEDRLMEIQYFIVRDFRLDPALFKHCHSDAKRLCHASDDWVKVESTDVNNSPMIFPCLYRHMKHHDRDPDLQVSRACKHDIHRVMRHRAKRVELDPEIEKHCLKDMGRLCSDLDNYHKGEEIACLQDNYDRLEDDKCHELIGNITEDEDEFLELDNILMKACTPMIKHFCDEDLDEDAEADEIMDCLIEHKYHPDMDQKCAAGVEHHQLISLKDFRFNHKFKEACKKSVMKYCKRMKHKYEVVSCLSEHVRNDTLKEAKHRIDKQCRKQLRVEILQRAETIDLDPKLKTACEKDIQQMCNVEHGNSKVVECLRSKIERLSKSCHKLLFKREREESSVGDYKLNMACKQMIQLYCDLKEGDAVLDCLKMNKEKPNFDPKCRSVVIRRQISQNKDYRLNPSLKKACKMDIPKFCRDILNQQKNDEELEGKMIHCLRKHFLINRLSRECHHEIEAIIKESSLNYLEDPVLAKACKHEIHQYCSDQIEEVEKNANEVSDNGRGKVEECLKDKFHQKLITNPKCKQEIARINQETLVDINVDPLLHTACQKDLYKFCGDIEPGEGKQMACLLAEFEDHPNRLNVECFKLLKQRKELWELSAQVAPVEGLSQLYDQISMSPSKSYILGVICAVIGVIFLVGITCGRVTKRVSKENKNK